MRWAFPAEQALIVGHGTGVPEDRTDAPVALEDLHGFADGSDSHLGRQAKAVPQLAVAAAMDGLLVEDVVGKADVCRMGRSRVVGPHGGQQGGVLFRRWDKPELQGQFHGKSIGYYQSVSKKKVALAGNAFLLPQA